MLQPSHESVDAVRSWLESAGIDDIHQDADWLTIRTTVEKANKMLDTKFKFYSQTFRFWRCKTGNKIKDIIKIMLKIYCSID